MGSDLSDKKEPVRQSRRVSQAEGTLSAKALRQEAGASVTSSRRVCGWEELDHPALRRGPLIYPKWLDKID